MVACVLCAAVDGLGRGCACGVGAAVGELDDLCPGVGPLGSDDFGGVADLAGLCCVSLQGAGVCCA